MISSKKICLSDFVTKSKFQFINFILDFVYRILVGAPLGQNLQPATNRSGALFKCPITPFQNDCTQVITDGRRCKSFKKKALLLLRNVRIRVVHEHVTFLS